MIVQRIYSSSGLLMRHELANTPSEAEQLARAAAQFLSPERIRLQMLRDEIQRKQHPYRKDKTAKDRRPAK